MKRICLCLPCLAHPFIISSQQHSHESQVCMSACYCMDDNHSVCRVQYSIVHIVPCGFVLYFSISCSDDCNCVSVVNSVNGSMTSKKCLIRPV